MRRTGTIVALIILLAAAAAGPAAARTQGVSDDEIVIGGLHDLSGVFAAFSVSAVEAANLYFEEVNAAGGVHGRQIRYIVEDHGYQVPRAIQGANKLVNRDRVFALFMNLGTPHNLAAFRLTDRKGLPNVYPLTLARQMLEPPAERKFVSTASYYDVIRATTAYLAEHRDRSTVCSMYIPSDFGEEIHAGAFDEARELGLAFGAESTHKPDETDFQGALAKLDEAGCDMVALGLAIRGIITVVGTAKKLGLDDMDFYVSSAGFHSAIPQVPGGVTEGLWAGAGWRDFGERLDEPAVAAWVSAYEAATGELPNSASQLGYLSARVLVEGLRAAGPELTVERFVAGMESVAFDEPVNGLKVRLGPDDHVGSDEIYISRIGDGLWRFVEQAR